MNTFYIEFRDPLFGIIIFFVLVFIITISSYWWTKYSNREKTKSLDKFLKDLKQTPLAQEMHDLISAGNLSIKSWMLLGSLYSKNGDFEKSIDIYNELLKVDDGSNTRELMYLLGRTYFKAGFLERAKQIFLNILKNNPRTPEALRYLLLVYEYMRDYDSAFEVLEPLDELKNNVVLDAHYLRAMQLINNSLIDLDTKNKKLIDIYKQDGDLTYMVFEHIFRVDSALAWKYFDGSKSELLVDILWSLSPDKLDLDIISKNSFLKELYSARGDIKAVTKSSIFELDVLINLQDRSNATLSFEYICDSCKQVFPFAFHRCSSCHAIDTIRVEFSLVKDYHRGIAQENNSLE